MRHYYTTTTNAAVYMLLSCVGVSYLLPADADRLTATELDQHNSHKLQATAQQQQRQEAVVDERHRPFIDDVVYVYLVITVIIINSQVLQ